MLIKYIKRRIRSVGMLWGKNSSAWLGHVIKRGTERQPVLNDLVLHHELVPIKIEGVKDTVYISTADFALLNEPHQYDNIAKIIAPLDNMLWDRSLVEQIFNFKYTWEVYLPASKRKYGYYVLPVLYKNQFVARFEPQKLSTDSELVIRQWWWEPGLKVTPEIKEAVFKGMNYFCKYVGTNKLSESSVKIISEV